MNIWIRRAKAKLSQRKGETLTESLVSVLILSIIISAVTMTIQTSLRITKNSADNAERKQETEVNHVIDETTTGAAKVISFSNEEIFGADSDDAATHNVVYITEGGIVSFIPME